MPRTFKPTAEQHAILDAVARGGDVKIKAYAGAGKTSTLGLVADRLAGKRGTYLAFNREIADQARRRFPSHVQASTVHSRAYASAAPALRSRMRLHPEPPHELAHRYGLGPMRVSSVYDKPVEIMPFEIGQMISDGLGRFCRSAQTWPAAAHIPVDEKIADDAAAAVREWLLPYVVRLWGEASDPRGRSAVSPDVLLKLWAQANPRIDADFILFDEAQDSDGVMLSVLELQRHAQIVYVGDPYQQIYEWRGAVNAMARIDAPQHALSESFRFGPTLAMLASRILKLLGEPTPIRGQDVIGSILVEDPSISPPVDAVLCRKNVTAIGQLAVGLESGHRPAIRMSPAEIEAFADGADRLLAGNRAFRPAAFSLFESWSDAQSFARSAVGGDLLPIVQMVEACGTDYLRALARRISPISQSDYVISTVHRSKGLEWKRVRIANDFRFKMVNGRLTLDDDELRLLYVAVTRARHLLDVSALRDELVRLITQPRRGHGEGGNTAPLCAARRG
ncbi:ATP-binding domain-containing protein [Burkholderia ubonensis]|uniref:DNA helicase n=1 Tax=Burkholderia ubonensis TaxID=101571 RepID=A0A107FF36_9BURK|nr:ATP-binding domain-containing protein [Burkholderia ubonensis]KWD85124.1 DNA helicase [Burkholderia ubonensis]KWD92330.1 DNA helicase [Burkholderia ubonensis]KWD94171.1 DNA helicase [Burkholderia ubonensis]KWD97050.1 DNA helicase [Burkholderia ubonensis]